MAKATLFGSKSNGPEKGTPEFMQQQYNVARANLLAAILFTVVNLAMLLLDVDRYFLFSIAVPYYGTLLGMALGYGAVMAVVAVVILAVYFLCWLFSKKHSGVMVLALVLFLLDCVALVGIMVLAELYSGMLLEILFHIWVAFYLIQAVRYGKKLQTAGVSSGISANPEVDAAAQPVPGTGPEISGKPEVKNRGPEID